MITCAKEKTIRLSKKTWDEIDATCAPIPEPIFKKSTPTLIPQELSDIKFKFKSKTLPPS
jgi:hypothetical protein